MEREKIVTTAPDLKADFVPEPEPVGHDSWNCTPAKKDSPSQALCLHPG